MVGFAYREVIKTHTPLLTDPQRGKESGRCGGLDRDNSEKYELSVAKRKERKQRWKAGSGERKVKGIKVTQTKIGGKPDHERMARKGDGEKSWRGEER